MEKFKAESMRWLKSHHISVPAHLPTIEPFEDVSPQPARSITARLCALTYVIGVGYGAPVDAHREKIQKFSLWTALSEYERGLMSEGTWQEQDKINTQWLTEAAQALLWVIGHAKLDHFAPCDDDLINKIPLDSDPSEYIKGATLRPVHEIQQQADLLYRLHWHARNCHLEGVECKISLSAVKERRRAIDWAYGVEENWDEVPSDT